MRCRDALFVALVFAALVACSSSKPSEAATNPSPLHGTAAFPCPPSPQPDGSTLHDECTTDADCASNAVCTCVQTPRAIGIATNTCVSASCRSDADCPATRGCGLSTQHGDGGGEFGAPGWYCHTAKDACTTDADCGVGQDGSAQSCAYGEASATWICGVGFAG
jgi:hypothetical protein